MVTLEARHFTLQFVQSL